MTALARSVATVADSTEYRIGKARAEGYRQGYAQGKFDAEPLTVLTGSGATVANDIETLALQIEDGAPDLDIDTIWQITRYLTACGYVSLARHDADIAAAKAEAERALLDRLGEEGGRFYDVLDREMADSLRKDREYVDAFRESERAAGAAEVVARVEAVASTWEALAPSVSASKRPAYRYCAAKLRAVLTAGGEGRG